MCEENKKLENLENLDLTDEQTENISGGVLQQFFESSINDTQQVEGKK